MAARGPRAPPSLADITPRSYVLHSCADFVAIDKPADLKMHGPDSPSVSEVLERDLGATAIKFVHQLDYPTSGVLVAAKSSAGAAAAASLFRHRRAEKTYVAIVQGHVCPSRYPKNAVEVAHLLERAASGAKGPGRGGKRRVQSTPAISFFQKHQSRVRRKRERGEELCDAEDALLGWSWKDVKANSERRRPYDEAAAKDKKEKEEQLGPVVTQKGRKFRRRNEAPVAERYVDARSADVRVHVLRREAPLVTEEEPDQLGFGVFATPEGDVVVDLSVSGAEQDFRMHLAPPAEGGRRASTIATVEWRGYVAIPRSAVVGQQLPEGTIRGKEEEGKREGEREVVYVPVTKLRLRLLTGRRHQLRVHCLAMGHPIVGDATYAPSDVLTALASRMCLHAWILKLPLNRYQETSKGNLVDVPGSEGDTAAPESEEEPRRVYEMPEHLEAPDPFVYSMSLLEDEKDVIQIEGDRIGPAAEIAGLRVHVTKSPNGPQTLKKEEMH